MKHASAEALAGYAALLAALRALPLREKGPGRFYRGSAAFLHFHEDAAGLFADLKVAGDWERSRVTTRPEQAAFVRRTRAVLMSERGK